jgi:seryl-tRNA synthetase
VPGTYRYRSLAAVIDVRLLRTDYEGVRAALARRHDESALDGLERALAIGARLRELTAERDSLRAKINELSAQVAQARRSGEGDRADALQAESRELGEHERRLTVEHDEIAAELRAELLIIPNVPSELAPDGESEADNPVVKGPFVPDTFAEHQRVPHWESATALGILDNERATKVAKAMFTMQRGAGATLARALCQLALDRNADEFEEIRAPTLVSTATLTATGQLPKFADDAFMIERDDLWCIPTAEVPLTSLYAGEVLAETELPMRFMAYSPSYRREAGSAGRDTRGMLRAHEFDKVEILALSTPEQAPGLLDDMLSRVEATIAALGLPYRIIEICTGDLGQSHHRSFDVEVYAPGADAWLEVSSVSWFSDYQARRADIRYRPSGQKGTALVHTLNGSALAVPRVWAAIVENFRDADGSVCVPEVLHPYMRGITRIEPR